MKAQFWGEENDTIQHQMKTGMAPLHWVLLALVLPLAGRHRRDPSSPACRRLGGSGSNFKGGLMRWQPESTFQMTVLLY